MSTRSTVRFAVAAAVFAAMLCMPLASSALPHFQTFDSVYHEIEVAGGGGGGGGGDDSLLILLLLLEHEPPAEAGKVLMRLRNGGVLRDTIHGSLAECSQAPAGYVWSWGRRSRVMTVKQPAGALELRYFAEGSPKCHLRVPLSAKILETMTEWAAADAQATARVRSKKPIEIVVVGSDRS